MKWLAFLTAALLGLPAFAQPSEMDFEDLAASAEQWAQENLDQELLAAIESGDRKKLESALARLNQQLQGAYVLDLVQVKEAARQVLPLLESYEETFPLAVWLKTRMDYFDVAEQLRPASAPKTNGEQTRPAPNPPAEKERAVWIQKVAKRPWPTQASAFISKLKPVFATHGVPPELVWIAEVESSFDARARSPAGAAGLFQLMPATAKRYGLRTWPFDQRLAPEAAGAAAAKYLRYLHGHYKDWRLALAAYNSGEGTVDQALARSKTKTFDAIATRLPAETQFYVPKVEATLWRRENVRLVKGAWVRAEG